MTPNDVTSSIDALGLSFEESVEHDRFVWLILLADRVELEITLWPQNNLMQIASSALIDCSQDDSPSRTQLLEAVLQRNAHLQIGHYELASEALRFRACLPAEQSEISSELIERCIRSAVAETCLFRAQLTKTMP